MSVGFDPYYTWLGIPPAEQPPDHYRLLGIARFESNAEVIRHAAHRQMVHVRSLQTPVNRPVSQKILNEIGNAQTCLLQPKDKAMYDVQLRERLALGTRSATGERVFGDYVLLEPLAESRTGKIFKAKHRTMGRLAALKLFSPRAASMPQLLERFERKIRILARLNHPNLVAAQMAGEFQGTRYLAMEYVEGRDLGSLVKQGGPLSVDAAVRCLIQAAMGLAHSHTMGVFHRNVKPGNLMLDQQGVVKLVGFGLAHVEAGAPGDQEGGEAELTQQGQLVGSQEYMAPEQILNANQADQRADVYSLGCTLHTLLTGRPPYSGKSLMDQLMAHRNQPIPSLRATRPDVPEVLDVIFQKMLAKRPEDRYQSMTELIEHLNRPQQSPAPPVVQAPRPQSILPPPLASERPRKAWLVWSSRVVWELAHQKQMLLAIGAILLCVAVTLAVLFSTKSKSEPAPPPGAVEKPASATGQPPDEGK